MEAGMDLKNPGSCVVLVAIKRGEDAHSVSETKMLAQISTNFSGNGTIDLAYFLDKTRLIKRSDLSDFNH